MANKFLKILYYMLFPFAVVFFLYWNGYPDDQMLFMKGRVALEHSYIEHKCWKCHIPWKGVTNDSCIECHVDSKHYLRNGLDEVKVRKLRCFDCHQEHRGRSYDLESAEYVDPVF